MKYTRGTKLEDSMGMTWLCVGVNKHGIDKFVMLFFFNCEEQALAYFPLEKDM